MRKVAGRVFMVGWMLVWLVVAPVARAADLSGVYHCDGGTYTGTVIIRRVGDTYNLLWTIGNETHVGVGIQTGDVLASSWLSGQSGAGIVVYTVEAGQRLVGKYSAYPGNGQLLTEVLTYSSPAG
ncbi:MAG: hypothetical protein HYZ96_01715 [Candidatus Omnitrophica bacterium]|nr:hypothetical protein [Candidatus Omnitrophota bacterium]